MYAERDTMGMLTILWKKELKNSVPFEVFYNGNSIGTIKRGGTLQCEPGTQPFRLSFSPKAPKWYGWKTLIIDAEPVLNSDAKLVMSVILPSLYMVFSAINPLNQLHVYSCEGLNNVKQEHLK